MMDLASMHPLLAMSCLCTSATEIGMGLEEANGTKASGPVLTRAAWADFLRTMGVAAMDSLQAWERDQHERFGRRWTCSASLKMARHLLLSGKPADVQATLRRDTWRMVKSFDSEHAGESEMATVACGITWRRLFAEGVRLVTQVEPGRFEDLHIFVEATDADERLWGIAAKCPSRDPATFEPAAYAEMIDMAMYVVEPEPYENGLLPPSLVRRRLRSRASDWENLRPGFLAARWALDVGVLRKIWDYVDAGEES
jgi:hypothetical protein